LFPRSAVQSGPITTRLNHQARRRFFSGLGIAEIARSRVTRAAKRECSNVTFFA
jgi:hypothetical protein